MTTHILQDGSSKFDIDLYPQFQEQMSEATTIMPTLPSIRVRYDDGSESDNDEDIDQQPSIQNRHEKAAESDNDEDTDDSDYISDSNISDVIATAAIATANNQTKEMRTMSRLSASSSPREEKNNQRENK